MPWIQVLNCQNCKLCLKCHKSPGLSFQLSKWQKAIVWRGTRVTSRYLVKMEYLSNRRTKMESFFCVWCIYGIEGHLKKEKQYYILFCLFCTMNYNIAPFSHTFNVQNIWFGKCSESLRASTKPNLISTKERADM